jgi:hypothetical protein
MGEMSKPTEVIVLCEDYRQSSFALAYLKRCGISRGIRPILSPHGRGRAFDWVVKQYPVQVNAYRLAKARKHTWLIVAIDADTGTVAQRLGQMELELRQSAEPRLRELDPEDELIARLIPRRNIETWILALNNVAVNEIDDYKYTRAREDWAALIPTATAAFYDRARPNAEWPDALLESLRHGIHEMCRISQMAR